MKKSLINFAINILVVLAALLGASVLIFLSYKAIELQSAFYLILLVVSFVVILAAFLTSLD